MDEDRVVPMFVDDLDPEESGYFYWHEDDEWYDDPEYDDYVSPTRLDYVRYWLRGLVYSLRYRLDRRFRDRMDEIPF